MNSNIESQIYIEHLVCTHVDELVEVWYPLDGVADDEDDGDGQADLGQRQLLLPRRAADASVPWRRGGARITALVLEVEIKLKLDYRVALKGGP